jgi:hypothetical protein
MTLSEPEVSSCERLSHGTQVGMSLVRRCYLLVTNVGSSLVTNAGRRPLRTTPAPSFGLHYPLAGLPSVACTSAPNANLLLLEVDAPAVTRDRSDLRWHSHDR